jgi:hypothetical protein
MTTSSSTSPTSTPRRSAKNAQYAFNKSGHIQPSAKRNKKRPTHTARNHRHASTSQKKPPVRRRPVPAAAHLEWIRRHQHRHHRHRRRHGSACHLQWFFWGSLAASNVSFFSGSGTGLYSGATIFTSGREWVPGGSVAVTELGTFFPAAVLVAGAFLRRRRRGH